MRYLLLIVVVIGLVLAGGCKKEPAKTETTSAQPASPPVPPPDPALAMVPKSIEKEPFGKEFVEKLSPIVKKYGAENVATIELIGMREGVGEMEKRLEPMKANIQPEEWVVMTHPTGSGTQRVYIIAAPVTDLNALAKQLPPLAGAKFKDTPRRMVQGQVEEYYFKKGIKPIVKPKAGATTRPSGQ